MPGKTGDSGGATPAPLVILAPAHICPSLLGAASAASGVSAEPLSTYSPSETAQSSARRVAIGVCAASSFAAAEALCNVGAKLLIIHPSPEETIAQSLREASDAENAAERWSSETEALLALVGRHRAACTLIDARAATSAPDDFHFFCRDRYNLTLQIFDPPQDDLAPGPLERFLAKSLIAMSPRARALREELSAKSFPVSDVETTVEIDAAFDDMKKLIAAREKSLEAQRSADVLRSQLHLSQYLLETRFKRTEQRLIDTAETKLAAAETERDRLAGELAAIKSDIFWRLTTPIRRVARKLNALTIGRIRNRRLADVVRNSPLFDAAWYASEYKDVAAQNIDPALHYVRFGGVEGRAPGPNFNGAAYLAANPDLAGRDVNPLVHYILHGQREGRSISPRGTIPRPKSA